MTCHPRKRVGDKPNPDAKTVHLLWHVNELPTGEADSKFIGVYASIKDAEQAKKRLGVQPGFRDTPQGFQIEGHEVGRDHWTEGFVTVTE